MFTRATEFSFGPNGRKTALQALATFRPIVTKLPGFISATFMSGNKEDLSEGDFLSITVWKTRGDAEAASKIMEPVIDDFLKATGNPGRGPIIRYYEVLEP